MVAGDISKGARRWLDLGVLRFQPSEIMKLAVPMMMSWYFANKPLCRHGCGICWAGVDYRGAVSVDCQTAGSGHGAGGGLRWGLRAVSCRAELDHSVRSGRGAGCRSAAVLDLRHARLPAPAGADFPRSGKRSVGAGYHIIQSKIAIGSGGIYGKGWLNGTQSHLDFLPEGSTDFIFAAFSEEFGLVGGCLLLALYFFVIARCLYMATHTPDTYTRLLAGSLTLIFFVYAFVNSGMVSGLLPVVGLPLPLFSYGEHP